MSFKVAFIAHAPDAEADKHSCIVKTPKYNLFVKVVRDQGQAVEVSRKLATEEGIHSILLCPGFTHKNVAEIREAVGEQIGVFVARGDGPSHNISKEIMGREGWFLEQ